MYIILRKKKAAALLGVSKEVGLEESVKFVHFSCIECRTNINRERQYIL